MDSGFWISASVDVLIQYKAGDLNLLEAIERFSSLTGLPRDSAENSSGA